MIISDKEASLSVSLIVVLKVTTSLSLCLLAFERLRLLFIPGMLLSLIKQTSDTVSVSTSLGFSEQICLGAICKISLSIEENIRVGS